MGEPRRQRESLRANRAIGELAGTAGWTALMMAALVAVVQTLMAVVRSGLWAGDLPAYLVGWRLARTPGILYNLDAQRATAGTVLGKPGPVPACPFNYPPHLAAIGRLLPPMTYNGTLHVWLAVSAAIMVALVVTWVRVSSYRVPVGIAALASPPVAVSLLTGSILPIAAAGAIAAVVAVQRSGYRWTVIGVLGWLAVGTKPHLAVVLAAVCLILATRRALITLTAAVPFLVIGPTVLLGPRIWTSWLTFLGQFSRSTEGDLMCRVPRAAPNIEGMLTRAGWAPPLGLIWAGYVVTIALLIVWVVRCRPNIAHACMWGAALVPLTAPHANPQDLLLCVPLLAAPLARRSPVATAWTAIVAAVLLSGTDNFTVAVEVGVAATLVAAALSAVRRQPAQQLA